MLVNMRDILADAEEGRYAIPCINTPNVEFLRAVIGAAEDLNTPVIIDHAEVHDSLIPIERIGPEMVKYASMTKVPVCVHLDHGTTYSFLMRALKAGFSSIMYDCSALPFGENVRLVKEFVKVAHDLDITVEGELGVMASSGEDTHGSEDVVLTNAGIRKYFTDPDEAGRFVEETDVDALAVCFGTMHGIYSEPPILDIDRVKAIRAAMPKDCRVVMHGASGVEWSQIRAAIDAGCTKVNYYSYMSKATTEFAGEKIRETEGRIAYHELQEAACVYARGYAKKVLTEFRNGK